MTDDRILRMTNVLLSNPNCKTIVIDHQPEEPPFLMGFNLNWNQLRSKIEAREALTKHLLAGGPVE